MTKPFTAAYRSMSPETLLERVRWAEASLRVCNLCPRNCGVDRTAGEFGFCRTGNRPVVASWGAHFGEERPLVGCFGSGAIFFTNCNLGCVFCQNWTISRLGEGQHISCQKLASIMIDLQDAGCHNINFVTPTHQMPMILQAIALASERGLTVPLVYNCGGYESVDALRLLDGIVDIYMPDIKYANPDVAGKLSSAKDYPERSREALMEMFRQVGNLKIDRRGIALRGLLVRHLVLPERLAGTRDIASWIAEAISKDTYINIMDQYRPCFEAYEYTSIDRCITAAEHQDAVEIALATGLRRIDGVSL